MQHNHWVDNEAIHRKRMIWANIEIGFIIIAGSMVIASAGHMAWVLANKVCY